ncbi:ATP-binding cassette domain-containing protein [Methanolobus bombayensis]|uniref:ATP-binding cassette domain-containing protein n=1 Tax=Methanolobus bombayensis TaxID=38023 RepID=UPI001AE1BBF6|nr:ATP-binding cassette domain-containing protein [Methanolobus bombayensis]MBP1909768.1 methyl coenzyme M reductase system subunit A2 [Methanolobus bombayensis]
MLEVSNIVKEYEFKDEVKRILDNVSFNVADGEILGITGKSGCGKTTILKILRGLEDFQSGYFEIDGERIEPGAGKDKLKFLAFNSAIHLQRNFGLWNGPAVENIIRRLNFLEEGHEGLPDTEAYNYDELYEKAMYYMRLVRLDHKAKHSSNLLSGGEKQRLILARQLAAQPHLLLLDEPVTMTDPGTKQEMLDVIKDIRKELNIPIIVVSHLPEIHLYLADRVVYLEGGKVIETGEAKYVLKHFLKDIKEQTPLAEINSKEPIIKVRGLSNRFALLRVGEVLKFEDLSLEINKGEITSLIGPSGAGKTTLLKMIEGLRYPKEGEITYLHDGNWLNIIDFTIQRLDLRRKMSIMHQEFTLSPHSTIRDQLAFKLRLKGETSLKYAREKAAELGISDEKLDILYKLTEVTEEEKDKTLSEMGLTIDVYAKLFPTITKGTVDTQAAQVFETLDLPMSVLDKTPYQISGGEHVRAYIALALVTRPEILMLDEPFGDLDPVTLRDVTNSLKNINRKFGTTIVFVSHHTDFVREAAHRAILLDDAKIIMDGNPEEVCHKLIEMSDAKYLEHDISELIES